MNKCNKCYHNKVCLDSANYKKAENCSQFKDKSLIVELCIGKWLINSDGYYPYCSNCGNEPPGRRMTNYCSSCGASMKERDSNA